MHLMARECFWDEEIPGAIASRDAKWKKFIETTREWTEKLLDMLESLEENPVLLYDFHADEDRWPDAHGPEIADSEDEGLLSEKDVICCMMVESNFHIFFESIQRRLWYRARLHS